MANRINHQEVVKKVLEMKAVDFAAIGATLTELGPALALGDEPWDGFCGTMRTFIHIYVLPGTRGAPSVENLGQLRGVATELQG